jgi:hypothetical protein
MRYFRCFLANNPRGTSLAAVQDPHLLDFVQTMSCLVLHATLAFATVLIYVSHSFLMRGKRTDWPRDFILPIPTSKVRRQEDQPCKFDVDVENQYIAVSVMEDQNFR